MVPFAVIESVMIHPTMVLLYSFNAINLSRDLFCPSGRFSIIMVVDSICGIVLQVMISLLLTETQANVTIWPTLTFCDKVTAAINSIPMIA